MASIKESAQNYVAPTFKTIAELDKVSVAYDIYEKTFKEGTADEFKVNLTKIEGEEYRVPASVLATIKEILVIKPDMEFFKVTKSGEGLKTKYQVIPL